MLKKLLMLIPAYKRKVEKEAHEKLQAELKEKEDAMRRAYRGRICYHKLMERIKDAPQVRAARIKRLNKAAKIRERNGLDKNRKYEGFVDDEVFGGRYK
jgi:hypothetical protein